MNRRKNTARGSMRGALYACIVGVFGGVFGCEASGVPATPQVPTWLHHPGGTLSITLRRPLTADVRKQTESYERGQPVLDVAGRRVFVGSSDSGMYCLRAQDGSTLWRFETMGPVQSEPLYDATEDTLYFGSNDGALYKISALDGKLLWRFSTNAEILRRPVMRDGVVFVVNANDTLVAVKAATGELKWHQHRTPAFGMEVSGYAGPTLGRDKIYVAYSDGVVMAYDIGDGSEQWPIVDLAAEADANGPGDRARYLDVDTTPVVARISSGDVVFVGSYGGGVFALDAENGTRAWVNEKAIGVTELMMWEQPQHSPHLGGSLVVDAQRILFASSGLTGLWALDPNDGRTLWRRNLAEGGITMPVAVAGALLVGTSRYGLFLFSPVNGGLIDGILPGGSFAMVPAAHGTRAYVLDNAGAFLGIQVQAPSGTPKKAEWPTF